jgi:hypothetical protein
MYSKVYETGRNISKYSARCVFFTGKLRAHTQREERKVRENGRENGVGNNQCTSGGGLDELPSDEMLAPSRPVVNPSISHSDVSESLSRDVVLGGDR